MGWFGQSTESTLTLGARRVSEIVAGLQGQAKSTAIATVAACLQAVRGLNTLPPQLTKELWGILTTLARKSLMGGTADDLWLEVKAGISDELLHLVEDLDR